MVQDLIIQILAGSYGRIFFQGFIDLRLDFPLEGLFEVLQVLDVLRAVGIDSLGGPVDGVTNDIIAP